MQRNFLHSLYHLRFMLIGLSSLILLSSACGPEPTDSSPQAMTPTPLPQATSLPINPVVALPTATTTATPAPPTALPVPTATPTPLARVLTERPTPPAAPNCFARPFAATGRESVSSVVALDATTLIASMYNAATGRTTFYRSEDAGQTWTAGRTYNDHINSVTPSPTLMSEGLLFASGLGGIYRSGDYGVNWFVISPSNWVTTTPTTRLLALSPAFEQDRLLLLGSQSLPRGVYAFNDGVSFRWKDWLVDAVDALHVSPNFANDRTVWASRKDERTFRRDVMVTTNQGEQWLPVRTIGVRPIAISPAFSLDSTIIWEGYSGGLYLSRNSDVYAPLLEKAASDGLSIWRRDPQKGWVVAGEQMVNDLVFSPDFARDRTAFGVTAQALIVTRDGGVSWAPLCYWADAQTPADFERLAISPDFANDQTIFAAGLGAQVAISRDGGKSWAPSAFRK